MIFIICLCNHAFGDHRRCSEEFCKFTTSSNTSNVDHEDTESQHKLPVEDFSISILRGVALHGEQGFRCTMVYL